MNVYISFEFMVAACVAVMAIGIYMTVNENKLMNQIKNRK